MRVVQQARKQAGLEVTVGESVAVSIAIVRA